MKQTLLLILFIICSIGIAVYAHHYKNTSVLTSNETEYKKGNNADLEILPTMNTISSAKNQVWVGTFQLVWNDLADEIIKGPIEFYDYHSQMADNLNKKFFDANDLSDSAYYKKCGLASPELKTEIENGIKQKFNEKSDILDSLDWTPAEKKYILYAMLKKDFEFIEKLNNLGKDKFNGSENNVEYFGVTEHSKNAQKKSVEVLFYNSRNDYAVALKSKQGDIIKLYRTNDDKTLRDYYDDMNKKSDYEEYKLTFHDNDELKVPMMDFKLLTSFDELCGKRIKNSEILISKAIETIQFKMDEAGIKLKSEAAIVTEKTALPQKRVIEPRYFYFDDKFVMFISEEGKKPYFGIKVTDAAKLQKQ